MAKSALELAVETGKWDAGLKKAKSALDSFTEANGGLQKALSSDSDKMKQFVQMMGRTESTAKTAKGQMNDYKGTIEALTMQYNRMTDAQKAAVGQTYLQAIDQMKQKYQGVAQEVAKINQSLSTMPEPAAATKGGGLFGGGKLDGMLQVFGGNLMTKGAGMLAGLASEMGDMVKQGIELAQQGEGIRIAFERLGRGDILDGLREATHGTVTDLELMKAAVKFNDFKLPLDELGTMLAFAQQKAKDTGQSVDYMVDSIVTGLGRKSLMILDNLGLSATEIRDKMKETGDMTKAVGEIIREQMSKAGDYIETAADRATKANVELENAMTRLGETFQPLTGAANSMWNNIKIGALDLLNNAVKPLIQALAEAGALGSGARATAGYNSLGGGSKVDRMIGRLGNGKTDRAYNIYQKQLEEFDKYINNKRFQIAAFGSDNSSIAQSAKQRLQTQLDGALKMRAEYVKRAQELHNKVPSPFEPAKTSGGTTGGTGGSGGGNNEPDLSKVPFDINKAALAATKGIEGGPSDVFTAYKDSMKEQTDTTNDLIEAFKTLNKAEGVDTNKQKPEPQGEYKSFSNEMANITQGVSGIVSGIEQLGIDIPEGLKSVLGGIQAVAGILTGISALVTIITAIQGTKSIPVIGWMLSHGGVVPHAANGYYVPGTHASGDVTPIMANAGELVLNESSQDNLALGIRSAESLLNTIDRYQESIMRGSQYNYVTPTIGGGMLGNMKLEAMITGEQIRLVLNNNGRRTGRGEYVTTNFR